MVAKFLTFPLYNAKFPKRRYTRFSAVLAAAAAVAINALPAMAQVNVTAINGTLYHTDAIAALTTNGTQMTGMLVTANFVGGGTETVSWAPRTGTTGGASGTGWSLINWGNTTYDAGSWVIYNNTAPGITSLVLNGAPANTVFDRYFGGIEGTPGSSNGLDFAVTSSSGSYAIDAEYSNILKVGTSAPVGDLYTTLSIRFKDLTNGFGSGNTLNFSADTDNAPAGAVITAAAPEPGTLSLLGMGLASGAGILGVASQRRRSTYASAKRCIV